MLPATIYLALLGAVLAATGIGGFFYLRRRVDVLAARQARRLAEEQARTLRALAARIDVLEAGEHER